MNTSPNPAGRRLGWISSASRVLPLLLAAFFAVGAFGNFFAPPEIMADYTRWGYPSWFHYVTAVCEAVAAVMLANPMTRLAGSILAALVMAVAAVSILLAGEAGRAVAPVAVLVVVVGVMALTRREIRKDNP